VRALNPFSQRASEHAVSDANFASQFSPEVLNLLTPEVFKGIATYVRSAPGAGKTTLLRIFTPSVLHYLCRMNSTDQVRETYAALTDLGVIENNSPRVLGIYLSCAAGYTDIPPTFAKGVAEGTFRALTNCRIVSRAVRAAMALASTDNPANIAVDFSAENEQLKYIPLCEDGAALLDWASSIERKIYATLDALGPAPAVPSECNHQTFEAIAWLGDVHFQIDNREIGQDKLLMFDDMHRLARAQRVLLRDEVATMRSPTPVWLAERTIVLGLDELFSQGARIGRDFIEISLDAQWASASGGRSFRRFVESVSERRARDEQLVLGGTLAGRLTDSLTEIDNEVIRSTINTLLDRLAESDAKADFRYSAWIEDWRSQDFDNMSERLARLQEIAILVARDQRKSQLDLSLEPLSAAELHNKSLSGLRNAARIQLKADFGIPYYYGFDQISLLASYNIDEFLGIASKLYERLLAKRTVRSTVSLSVKEQEGIVTKLSRSRLADIQQFHTHGERAKTLLTAIGKFCSEKTHLNNAPYAPGVTGIAFDNKAILQLQEGLRPGAGKGYAELAKVIQECVAENLLLVDRDVKQGGKRWTVMYLNRLVGVQFDLPCSRGGWQPVTLNALLRWMYTGEPTVN